MATKEDVPVEDTPTKAPAEAPKTDEPKTDEFRDEQKALAAEQGLTAENAVPEQRPQASQMPNPSPPDELTQRLMDSGDANIPVEEPMDQAAYDKAGSDSQAKKSAKESVSEGIMVGNVVRATKGPHEGRIIAVTRILSYADPADLLRSAVGSPEQLYNTPREIEGRAIRDSRDGEVLILDVEEAGLEKYRETSGAGGPYGRR